MEIDRNRVDDNFVNANFSRVGIDRPQKLSPESSLALNRNDGAGNQRTRCKIFQPKYHWVLEESEFLPHPGQGKLLVLFTALNTD